MFHSYCFDMLYSDVLLSHLNKDYLLTMIHSVHSLPICIAHRCKPPLMRSGMAHVRGITQFILTPTRLSTNGINHLVFTL